MTQYLVYITVYLCILCEPIFGDDQSPCWWVHLSIDHLLPRKMIRKTGHDTGQDLPVIGYILYN